MRRLAAAVVTVLVAGCAARVPPPLPATLRHPDFIYPTVPAAFKDSIEASRVDAGWRFLQVGDLRNAGREFAAAMRRSPSFHPARTGAGYVELARRSYDEALSEFAAALSHAPTYAPALVGRGQALLGLKRSADALAAFEAAVAADPSLTDVQRRIEVLRFRGAQAGVERARAAALAGRLDEARAAYREALEGSPDSPLLHRELGIVERRRGDSQAALEELRTAVELDPYDVVSLVEMAELLEQRLDFVGAESLYREAAEIEPSDALTKRIADVAEKARLAKLPPEFHAIPESPQITRGELAALIGIKLEPLLDRAQPRQVVITDARGHWAAPWIDAVARAGVIDPFANHTFQPGMRIQRGDLAAAASRLVLRAAGEGSERHRAWASAQPKIADMAPGHLRYPAVSVALASGAMTLDESGRFGVTRPVSGSEALDVLERVAALARDAR